MKLVTALAATLLATTTAHAAEPAPPSSAQSFLALGLNVSNIEKSLRFYRDGIGLTVVSTNGPEDNKETFLSFGNGGTMLMLVSGPRAAVSAGTRPTGFGKLVLRVRDIEPIRGRLIAAGFPADEAHVSQGHAVLLVSDPDGYVLEIVARVVAKN